jgi:hypothetical protein
MFGIPDAVTFVALIVPVVDIACPCERGLLTIDRQLDIRISGDVQPDAVTFDALLFLS